MPTGLTRRGARYSIRRRVPVDLIAHYGKAEIVKALGTSDPKEARRRLPVKWAEMDQEFDAVRAADRPLTMTDAAPPPVEKISPTVLSLIELDSLRDERDAAAERGELAEFINQRRDALRLLDAMLDGSVPAIGDLREIEGKRNALRAVLTGENAFAISAARKARQAIDGAGAKRPAASLPLGALVDRWAAERKPNERSVKAHQAVIRWFTERCGDLRTEAVTKRDVLTFKDKLLAEGVSAANINTKLSRLRTLFNYALSNDLITADPTRGVKVVDGTKAKNKRREFNKSDLQSLFGGPVHAHGERPIGGGGEAAYWLPLLALYTGARMTELGQLHPDDVMEEAYELPDGTELSAWVVRFVENEGKGQRVKNEGSERRVPLHSDLLSLGVLDMVGEAKRQNRQRIFHEINPAKHGELMASWSKWFGRYLRQTCGVDDTRVVFHSFRHSFKHYARLSNLPAEVSNAITGHETGDVANLYGGLTYPLAPLVEGMSRYRVPGFTLPSRPGSAQAFQDTHVYRKQSVLI